MLRTHGTNNKLSEKDYVIQYPSKPIYSLVVGTNARTNIDTECAKGIHVF